MSRSTVALASLDQAAAFLAEGLDGVMIGRAAYHHPSELLLDADRRIFGAQAPSKTAEDVVRAMIPYLEAHLGEGGRLQSVTRHMLGLFTGRPGARQWRRILSENAHRPEARRRSCRGRARCGDRGRQPRRLKTNCDHRLRRA